MVFISTILSPVIWAFDALARLIHRAIGKDQSVPLFLSREEVKMAFQDREEGEDEFNAILNRIFQLKNLTASQLMMPLSKVQMIPLATTLGEMRTAALENYSPMIPIYHRSPHNIVAIAHLRDLLRMDDKRRVFEQARSPWFVTRDTSVLQILEQFRRNNQSVAVILDSSGQACGILTLDLILEGIFGEEESVIDGPQIQTPLYVERTLPGEMPIQEFNQQFEAQLPHGEDQTTLSDLIISQLDHPPIKGETVQIDLFEFTVEEPTLRGVKTLSVRSNA
ncbi:MAG: transporter associated domain-containing protein, partial [Chlamydiota bacterium]